MSNNANTLLCDLGGTHARFARMVKKGEYDHFQKYRLNEFESFEGIIDRYIDDTGLQFDTIDFASARAPQDGIIRYRRHASDPDYVIDFNAIATHYNWPDLKVLNDLEAGTLGLPLLKDNQTETVIENTVSAWNERQILISVGTGIGHSGLADGHVLQTPGGHWLPITITDEHRKIENFITRKKEGDNSVIMEDFVSGRGLRAIAEYTSAFPNGDISPDEFMADLKNNRDAVRLFFEFLGIYANTITAVTGYYGGVYLTGGVIDNLIKHGLTNWDAFETYFRPAMVQSVEHRLNGCAVHYVLHDELPLLGLTTV